MKRLLFVVVLSLLLSAEDIDPFNDFDKFEASLPAPLSVKAQNVMLPPMFEKCWVTITGYSSEPNQTDDTPYVTSSNSRVEWGVLATNWLPFGAELTIPEYYGDQSFVVEDRMHMKNWHKADIWFPQTAHAWGWGKRKVLTEIRLDTVNSDFRCPPEDPVSEIPYDMVLWHGHRNITVAQATRLIASAN